jgi:hypothetical protein
MSDGAEARDVLPIPDTAYGGELPLDARDASFPPIEPLRPPPGAPNVLIVLLDDVGFSATSAFGGPVTTPTAERLASAGLSTTVSTPPRSARRRGRRF